jgi:peptidoglycan/LPS O-acetylase OafA/YrhL
LEHRPALDGIRAFAVVAVIAFHTLGTTLPGGYLGVDVFFTLSGYLITTLLIAEWRSRDAISLGRFWFWRARRLLPALFVMLIGVGVGAALWPQIFAGTSLRSDTVATVFQVANWHLIAEHSNYFLTTDLPLMHTWSLAIEEQFYWMWPVIVLVVLTVGRRRRAEEVFVGDHRAHDRRRLKMLLAISSTGALTSAVWMAVITTAGSDTARSYYASDTRAQGLLLGAALAVAMALWGPARSRGSLRALSFAGMGGVVGVGALWALVPENSVAAFHGAFLLTAVCTAGLIAYLVAGQQGVLSAVLGFRLFRYIGRISYGMYLWYWPVVLALSGPRLHTTGWALFVVRLAVIIAIATASAYLVELPIRRGRLPTWTTSLAMPAAAGVAVLTVFMATVEAAGPAIASASSSSPPATAGPSGGPGASAPSGANARSSQPATGGPGAAATAPGGSLFGAPTGEPVKALIVGDSVAGTLGVGLGRLSAQFGVVAVNEGSPGCSVSMDQLVQVLWFTGPPGTPCRQGDPSALLQRWRTWVDEWNPDVVVYLARSDVLNQEVGSVWEHVGEPSFDQYLTGRFRDAINVLGSRGARVVLLTSPYYDTGVQPSGGPWPEDDPSRVADDNHLITEVGSSAVDTSAAVLGGGADRSAGAGVTVIDMGSWLSPGGHYSATVDGVQARCSDGVHFTPAGGELVARRLLPEIAALGRAHQSASPTGGWSGEVAQVPPSWYAKLPC